MSEVKYLRELKNRANDILVCLVLSPDVRSVIEDLNRELIKSKRECNRLKREMKKAPPEDEA